jgi:hypothetical protein
MRIIPGMGEPQATRAAVEGFLAAPRLMYLGVTEPGGTPLVHPVWYTWACDRFLLHLETAFRKHRAMPAQPTVYFVIDETGLVGVRGKVTATLDPDRDRLGAVLQGQCQRYGRPEGSDTHRLVFGLLARGRCCWRCSLPITWRPGGSERARDTPPTAPQHSQNATIRGHTPVLRIWHRHVGTPRPPSLPPWAPFAWVTTGLTTHRTRLGALRRRVGAHPWVAHVAPGPQAGGPSGGIGFALGSGHCAAHMSLRAGARSRGHAGLSAVLP